MIQVPSIKDVFTTYSHNPEALKACREVMDIVESTVNEIIAKSKEVKATRSKATKEAVKPTAQPQSPLIQLISQAPKQLQPDLHAIRAIMLSESAAGMLDSIIDRTTPDAERDSIGQCLDELAEKHATELQLKHPDISPGILNRYIYQLAVLSLTDGAGITVNAIINQPNP